MYLVRAPFDGTPTGHYSVTLSGTGEFPRKRSTQPCIYTALIGAAKATLVWLQDAESYHLWQGRAAGSLSG